MATTEQLSACYAHIRQAYADMPEIGAKVSAWNTEVMARMNEVSMELPPQERLACYAAIHQDIESRKTPDERKGELRWLLAQGDSAKQLLEAKLSALIDSGQTLPD